MVNGVQRITSVSRPGLSQVTLEFGWGRDMDFAALDVRQKLDLVTLPREAERPVLLRFDPANDPIMRLYLTGGENLYQLRYLAEELVKKDLESTEGVAAVKVHGGYEEEIEVRIDEGRLALLGLGVDEVNSRLPAREPQPGRRQPVRGRSALPGARPQRVPRPRRHPRHRGAHRPGAAGDGRRRGRGHARPQAARRDHALRRRRGGRAGGLQGGRRQHRPRRAGGHRPARPDSRGASRGGHDLCGRRSVPLHRGVDPTRCCPTP